MGFRPRQLVGQMERRMPEQGRIRLGRQVATAKGGKRPDKLTTFRFTGRQYDVVAKIAELWGGSVAKWQDEWEVITDTHEIEVVLPDDPMGDTPIYELWSAGGLERRCDGEVCSSPRRVGNQPDDIEVVASGCICNAKQIEECKVTTRLRVILPQLPFGGTWRLETHSWNAATELPGMVDTVKAVTTGGFVKALLGIRTEEKVVAGKTKSFIVPYLRLDTSMVDALGGGAGLMALPAPRPPQPTGELAPASEAAPPSIMEQLDAALPKTAIDEPIDAEVVPDLHDLALRAEHLGVPVYVWAKAIDQVAGEGVEPSGDELIRLGGLLDRVAAGDELVIREDGKLVFRKRAPA